MPTYPGPKLDKKRKKKDTLQIFLIQHKLVLNVDEMWMRRDYAPRKWNEFVNTFIT